MFLRENNLEQHLNRFPVILTIKPSFIDPRELTDCELQCTQKPEIVFKALWLTPD